MKIKTYKLIVALLFMVSTGVLYAEDMTWREAPRFKFESMKGGEVSLTGLMSGGSIVILGFFDTNCKPCIKELPHLEKLFDRYRSDSNVKIRMIALDESKKVIKNYIKKYNVTLPVLHDPGGWKAGANYGVVKGGRAEIPQIFVVGKKGRIRKHIRGFKEHIETILTQTIEYLKNEKVNKKKVKEAAIIYSNSVNGYLESCNCPENPFGGLVRRMTAVKKIRKKHLNSILLDSGDNFSVRSDKLLAEYVLKMMSVIGYDAVCIGDQELIMGIDYLEKNINRLPFISANISRCDDTKCWDLTEAYKIKEIGGVKFAIIGVTNPDVFMLFPRDKIEGMDIRDHKEVLNGLIPSLKKRADIIILLSHSGDEEDKKIAQEIPGIDIIVGGHSQTLHKEPLKVGSTLIVQAGKDGHRLGKLILTFDKNKKIKSYKNEMILLLKDIPDDTAGKAIVEEYKVKAKKNLKKILIK